MKRDNFSLLNTSALVPTSGYFVGTASIAKESAADSGYKTGGGSIGFLKVVQHKCPPLSTKDIANISSDEPEFVTRHIEKCYIEKARMGYFRFGTLVNYRAKEEVVAGRLGDPEESRQRETLNSRTGHLWSLEVDGGGFYGCSVYGLDQQFVIETVVNDFCSCSSVGRFDAGRGQKLKDMESDPQKKPGAFVTYNLSKLKKALKKWARKEKSQYLSYKFFGRMVTYGQKDLFREVEENFQYSKEKDAVALWVGIAFVKSPKFEHEEEYRLLMVDPAKAGGLDRSLGPLIIDADDGIAQAIECSDFY